MNWFNFGIPRMLYAPEGAGGAGAGDGGQQQQSGGTTPPWGSDTNQMWMIDNKPWFDVVIPEGPTRELYQAKQYKNPVVSADAYHNLNKMLNVDKRVAVPDFNTAKPEEISAYYDSRGRPANAEAYDIKAPEGVTYDPKILGFGKTLAHELGLTPKEAETMVSKYNEFATAHLGAQAEAQNVANQAAVAQLEKTWGADLAVNKEAGLRVVKTLGLPEEVISGVEKHIGAAPLIDLLARIGKASAEGGGFKGGGGGGNADPASTPEGAAAEITRLRSDPVFNAKFTNANDPGHAEALRTMEALYAKAGRLAS